MSKKKPEPFFRKDRELWYVQIGKRQFNLGRDESEAWKRYHEMMARPPEVVAELVVGVIEGFLDSYQRRVDRQELAPRTYVWYQQHLQSFADWLPAPKSLAVDKLKPFHVHDWLDSKPTWGPNHRRGAVVAIKRAFSWAEMEGHIQKSPIRGVRKPPAKRREQFLTHSEFVALLKVVKDCSFRDILEFCWETGCRVQEVRVIEAGHFQPVRGYVELPPALAKGKKWLRAIYLTPRAEEIVRRLAARHPTGTLFRNVNGDPWTAQTFNCRFCRIRKKLGVKYSLTAFRHSFATRMLEAGLDHITVAALMGHRDASMLTKVYQHVGDKGDFLRAELLRVSGGAASA